MNQRNFIYLANQLEKTGFGRMMEPALQSAMKTAAPAFELSNPFQYGRDRNSMQTTLHYRRFDEENRYIFKHYEATLIDVSGRFLMAQTFFVDGPNTITAKEAFNLLEGRCVYKAVYIKNEPIHYTWIELDFTAVGTDSNYPFRPWREENGFDLEQALAKFPLWELKHDKPKAYLLQHLRKGNLTDATFLEDGRDVKKLLHVKPWDGVIIAGDIIPTENQSSVDLKQAEPGVKSRRRKKIHS